MKYHKNREGRYLKCTAEKGKCPFGADADKPITAIHKEAVTAFRTGMPIPTLLDTAGNKREFRFKQDGSYTFGARSYDPDGSMVPSARTLKKRRLKLWKFFAAMDEEKKAEQFDGDLLDYELARGPLRSTTLKREQFQAYADQHHKGSIRSFFRSIWDSITDAPSKKVRYRWTLNGMFTSVWDWLKKAS